MPDEKSLQRVAAVTGATGTIGGAIARQIAEKGFEVVLLARNEEKARNAIAEIRTATGTSGVRYELVDLSRKQSIQDLAGRWEGPLHILVNAAAQCPRRREETPDGIERQFATNVLGYYWMTEAFRPILGRSAPARVVMVASYWAGGLDLNDPEFKQRSYDNDSAYRQSKQADRMLARAFAERLKDDGISVNACHPGDVPSRLASDLGFGGHETPDQAAATPVLVATGPVGQENTGKYFEHGRESRCRFMEDRGGVEQLFELCASY